MRCLYCGKPLPLLKKLTGGGEFCSDAHRHKYQEEYNKLALSRLLQAQSAPGETGLFPAQGSGSGLRQLAAPAPPPPGGQRALPPPSAPAPAPPPPATAHHQDSPRAYGQPAAAARPVAEPKPQPTPPAPAPVPDPAEGPFLIQPHAAIGPAHPAAILQNLEASFAETRPELIQQEFGIVPFEWESAATAIAASQEPDPPEAPAWRHPMEIQPPGEWMPAAAAAFPAELFPAKPLFPVAPEVQFGSRFPQSIRPKVDLGNQKSGLRLVPAALRLSGVGDWELSLAAPDWMPGFATIGAPPPRVAAKVPAAQSAPSASAPNAPVEEARQESGIPPQSRQSAAGVEVFVDLSALGIFE
jgi:hypothetical protein